jgi:hypothetical protein
MYPSLSAKRCAAVLFPEAAGPSIAMMSFCSIPNYPILPYFYAPNIASILFLAFIQWADSL